MTPTDSDEPVSSDGTNGADTQEYSDYYPGDDRNTQPAPQAGHIPQTRPNRPR